MEDKNEKGKLMKKYLRRLRLVLDSYIKKKSNWINSSTSNKIFLKLLTCIKRTPKIGLENKANADRPCTASTKGKHRSFVCSQKTGRKRSDALRRSLRNISYKTDGIC
jgi:Zn-finger domain-containing protein